MRNDEFERLPVSVVLEVFRAPARVGGELQAGLAECWMTTTNAGGAVGFPWPPVTLEQVRPAVDRLVLDIEVGKTVLVVATDDHGVAGWVSLDRNDVAVVAHWATVRRLQTHPRARGLGIGRSLMTELARLACDDGLQQLHLAVRGGMGLEDFYGRLGWDVVGRWPGALRLADDDYRDEVLMVLDLSTRQVADPPRTRGRHGDGDGEDHEDDPDRENSQDTGNEEQGRGDVQGFRAPLW